MCVRPRVRVREKVGYSDLLRNRYGEKKSKGEKEQKMFSIFKNNFLLFNLLSQYSVSRKCWMTLSGIWRLTSRSRYCVSKRS